MPKALATVSLFLSPPQNPPTLFRFCQGDHQAKQGHLYSKAVSHVSMLSWTSPANSKSTITDITDITSCRSLGHGHELPNQLLISISATNASDMFQQYRRRSLPCSERSLGPLEFEGEQSVTGSLSPAMFSQPVC